MDLLTFSARLGIRACALAFALLVATAPAGTAQQATLAPGWLQAAPSNLENGIQWLGGKGAQFQFNYWGEGFANLSGGVKRGGDYEGLLKISLSLDLGTLLHWNGATLYASMLYPHGDGISGQYVHDYNLLSNIDAYDSPRLSELWLQQAFFGGKFSIRVGQLVTDANFYVSNNSNLFFNSAFGAIGTVLHDVNPPIYPVASEGVMASYDVTPNLYLQAMTVDDNLGYQNTNDKYGGRFGFSSGHGTLNFFEAGYIPDLSATGSAMGADYKLGGFYDSQFHPDISNQTSSHGDYGFYAVVDHPLYFAPGSTKDSPQGLSGFARLSYAPDQRNPVVYYFDTGFNYTGLLSWRPQDVAGLALSFERMGTDLTLASGAPVLSHHEHVLELTYLANVSSWFNIQPDCQYIINPGGVGRIPNALVAGVRFNVTF
jgi:porin